MRVLLESRISKQGGSWGLQAADLPVRRQETLDESEQLGIVFFVAESWQHQNSPDLSQMATAGWKCSAACFSWILPSPFLPTSSHSWSRPWPTSGFHFNLNLSLITVREAPGSKGYLGRIREGLQGLGSRMEATEEYGEVTDILEDCAKRQVDKQKHSCFHPTLQV